MNVQITKPWKKLWFFPWVEWCEKTAYLGDEPIVRYEVPSYRCYRWRKITH